MIAQHTTGTAPRSTEPREESAQGGRMLLLWMPHFAVVYALDEQVCRSVVVWSLTFSMCDIGEERKDLA